MVIGMGRATMGTGSFPGVKRPGPGADHPPTSKCRGHERVWLPLLPLWAFMACYGRTFTFTLASVWQFLPTYCAMGHFESATLATS